MITVEHFDSQHVILKGKSTLLFQFRSILNASRTNAEVVFIDRATIKLSRADFDWIVPKIQDLVDMPEELNIAGIELEALYEQHAQARELLQQRLEYGSSDIPPQWLEVLEPHQAVAVSALTTPGLLGVCLFDEQGTGKTLTTVAAFDTLFERDEIEALLVVAPKTLLGTWRKEFKDFIAGKYVLETIDGSASQRVSSIYKTADVYLASYETVSSEHVLLGALVQSRKFMIVFDESFMVKNSQSDRSVGSRFVRANANLALLLCGTPAPNSAIDLVNQFDLADLGFTFRGMSFRGGNGDAATIEACVESRGTYIRRLKVEVLPDLATKHHKVHEFELTPDQRQLYDEAKHELEIYLRRVDNKTFKRTLATYFQKRAALLQICVSPSLIGASAWESGKYDSLLKLAAELLEEPSKKIVVWSSFTESTNHIMSLLAKYNPVRVDGTVSSNEDRQTAIRSFQEDPSVRVFVGNPAAAGAGITLTKASDSIYVSFPSQAAYYMQSLDRTHRIGQLANTVTYHFLIGKDTLEKRELERLAAKQATQGDLFKDKLEPGVSLESALAELGY